jgi:hypothetical protein
MTSKKEYISMTQDIRTEAKEVRRYARIKHKVNLQTCYAGSTTADIERGKKEDYG